MPNSLPFIFFYPILLHLIVTPLPVTPQRALAPQPACQTKCGPLEIKYPLGTGHGCGSPRFYPYVTCSPASDPSAADDQLLLTTHAGAYPITSISYANSTITITPPSMSNCTSMHTSPTTLGLDWTSPFQLGPSTFILLSCAPPTSSLSVNGAPLCDPSATPYLCASIYTCPAVVGLDLPLFPPTNTCCVYSPANLNGRDDELDLDDLNCAGYSSVASLGEVPTDPAQWEYGVALKFTMGGLDGYDVDPGCSACETSGGVCGYAPPGNSFVCVCKLGFNTTNDCKNDNSDQEQFFLSSTSHSTWKLHWGLLGGLFFWMAS